MSEVGRAGVGINNRGPLDGVVHDLLQGVLVGVAVDVDLNVDVGNARALVLAQVTNAPGWGVVDVANDVELQLGQGNAALP